MTGRFLCVRVCPNWQRTFFYRVAINVDNFTMINVDKVRSPSEHDICERKFHFLSKINRTMISKVCNAFVIVFNKNKKTQNRNDEQNTKIKNSFIADKTISMIKRYFLNWFVSCSLFFSLSFYFSFSVTFIHLFRWNQRMDLGECPKVHDLALRADYEKAAKHKDYYYDIDVSILGRKTPNLVNKRNCPFPSKYFHY